MRTSDTYCNRKYPIKNSMTQAGVEPATFRYLYLRHSTVVCPTFVYSRETPMLESDALPLCYRAVLYGMHRYLTVIRLSIHVYWGNLWVWSVRERARPWSRAFERLHLMSDVFCHALPTLVTTRRRALSGRSNARRCY